MENNPTWLTVVAAAFCRDDGCWLMHRRPDEKHHGGLWEFPGGKVDPGETPQVALVREVSEELGIDLAAEALEPIAFAQSDADGEQLPIVILLYRIADWPGEPQALEGGGVDWFSPERILALPKPPLDQELVRQLFSGLAVDS